MVILHEIKADNSKMNKAIENSSKKVVMKHVKIETETQESSSDEEASDSDVGADQSDLDIEQNDKSPTQSDNDSSEDGIFKNEGWGDAVTKILGTNKPKNKKTLVLSRAKKFSEIQKKETKPDFDVVGEEKPKITDIKIDPDAAPVVKKKKIEHPTPRVKPNILEKDRERVLAKIATKGVVQLFNAVKDQQNAFSRELNAEGLSEGKKEKILKKFDKRTFLDTLMGNTKSTIVEQSSALKDEVKEENEPKWNALRDDFMMGAKMKDWDKSVDE